MKRTMLTKALVLSMVLGATSISIAAEKEEMYSDYTLPNLIVTANRAESYVEKTPADVTVITRQQIEENHYTDLGAALKTVPGVVLNNYGASGETYTANSLSINGSGSIVVLIDGMRANTNGSVSGVFQAGELVDMNAIERIEVLKGAASTLYGSDAQGGVINIITRKAPMDSLDVNLGLTAGSFGKRQANIALGGNQDNLYWQISAQKRRTRDFTDGIGRTVIDRTDSLALHGKLGTHLGETGKVEIDFATYQSDYVRPDTPAHPVPVEGSKDNRRIAIMHQDQIGESLEHQFKAYYNKNDLDDNKKTADRWLMNLVTYGASEQLTYRDEQHTLVAGVEYYKDRIDKYQDKYNSMTVMPSISTTSFFAQDDMKLSDQWSTTLGLRYDHNSVFGSKTSPSIVLQYAANEDWQVYASYKQYFTAPKLYHLYSAAYGNKDLKPEKGWQVEFGTKGKLDEKTTLSASLWSRESENVVTWAKDKPEDPNNWDGHYQNVAQEEARGLNVTLNHEMNNQWSTMIGYTYTYIKEKGKPDRNRSGSIPISAWKVGVTYQTENLVAHLMGRGVVDRPGNMRNKMPNKLTGYWLWDATVDYRIDDNLTAFATVNNIFDKHYTDQTDELNPDKWYSAPGRNFTVGMNYKF